MDKHEHTNRTRQFVVRVFKLAERFSKSAGTNVLTNQLLRSSSSVAANYRAVNRAKSKSDFINKLKIVLEESDESNFWLTFAGDIGILPISDPELQSLINESNEFVPIFASSVKTSSTKS